MKITQEQFDKQFDDSEWENVGLRFETIHVFDDDSQILEGIYLGSLTPKSATESMIHVIDADGYNVGVWGSTLLDDLLSGVEIGTYVVIGFFGKRPTKSGKNSYKVFDLKIKR